MKFSKAPIMTHAPMRSSEAQQKQKWRKLNMSKGQELEDLTASHLLPQKERNQRTTLNVIEEE